MAKYCEVCNLQLVNEDAYRCHSIGKKHIRKLELEEAKKKQEQNSIFVSPIPYNVRRRNILEFFSQFGEIKSNFFGSRFVIIEFTSKEPVENLLSKPIWMDNYLMNIRKRIINSSQDGVQNINNQSTSSEEKEDMKNVNLMLHSLDEETTFDGQLDRLLNLIQLDDSEVMVRSNICASLNHVLSQVFPKCKTIGFGSTVTGLHLRRSDMDIFIDIGEPVRDDDDSNFEAVNYRLGWTPKSIFREIKNLLFKNKHMFTHVIPIPMAKIPVIKFNYIPTNTDCDISFKHSFGVHNSSLIKYLLTLDPRVKPLIMMIKYWAKRLDIARTGKISNYSLIIAIIFYLQQPNVQILPTVKEIQSSCHPIFLSGWQINFDWEYKHNITNKNTIPELICGFFKFYGDLNFLDTIIFPNNGLIYQKADSQKVASLGVNIESSQLQTYACILDPIKFDHNIASNWTYETLQDFQKYCIKSVQVCEESAKYEYKNLLLSLYDSNIKQQVKKWKTYCTTVFAGKFEKLGLPANFEEDKNIRDKKRYVEDHWFHLTSKLIQAILEKVLKFKVQVLHSGQNLKHMKIGEKSDISSRKVDIIRLSCEGKHCLNRGRKSILTNLDVTLSPIERETIISDKLSVNLEQTRDKLPFKFTCSLVKKLNPLCINMKLTNTAIMNNDFTEISLYMVSTIPQLIDREFLHIAQYNKVV